MSWWGLCLRQGESVNVTLGSRVVGFGAGCWPAGYEILYFLLNTDLQKSCDTSLHAADGQVSTVFGNDLGARSARGNKERDKERRRSGETAPARPGGSSGGDGGKSRRGSGMTPPPMEYGHDVFSTFASSLARHGQPGEDSGVDTDCAGVVPHALPARV